MRTPVVLDSRMLFNLCCLGLVRVGAEEDDGSFNGKLLLEISNIFFKKSFTDVFVHQSLDATGSYEINVYFRFRFEGQHSIKNHFDEFDKGEDWFCISILDGKYCGGRYLRFRMGDGKVYLHDKTKESKYHPGIFYNVECDNIERPLTNIDFEKIKKDIDTTLNHDNVW